MSKTSYGGAAATSERELTEDDLALVSGGKPSAAKSSPAPIKFYIEGESTEQVHKDWVAI